MSNTGNGDNAKSFTGFPAPDNEYAYERVIRRVSIRRLGAVDDYAAALYGRRGTAQHGIDIMLRRPNGADVGIQCKNYLVTTLEVQKLEDDLRASEAITPPIHEFIVATTAPRRAELQNWARDARLHGKPVVQIWFWDDLRDDIANDPLLVRELLPIPTHVMASALAYDLGGTATGPDLMRWAVGDANDADQDARVVRELRELLRYDRVDQVRERLPALLAQYPRDRRLWRIAVQVDLITEGPEATIRRADAAKAAGVNDCIVETHRAEALRKLGETDRARDILVTQMRDAPTDRDHGSVAGVWLTLRRTVDDIHDPAVLGAELKASDWDYVPVRLTFAWMAAQRGNAEELERHLAELRKATDLGANVIPLLEAGQLVAQADRERTPGALERLGVAIAKLDNIVAALRHSPYAPNRTAALTLLARARTLSNDLVGADTAFRELLAATPQASEIVDLIASYAFDRHRTELIDELLAIPLARQTPLLRLAALVRRDEAGDDVDAIRRDWDALAREGMPTEVATAVLAAGLQLRHRDEASLYNAIDTVLKALPAANPSDPLILALSDRLVDGLPPAVANEVRSALLATDLTPLHLGTLTRLAHQTHGSREIAWCHRVLVALEQATQRVLDLAGAMLEEPLAHALVDALMMYRAWSLARAIAGRCFSANGPVLSRLEMAIAWQHGDFDAVFAYLDKRVQETHVAPAKDLCHWVDLAIFTGRWRAVRRRARSANMVWPVPKNAFDVVALASVYLRVGLRDRYVQLMHDHVDGKPLSPLLAQAVFAPIVLQRRLFRPRCVGVNTVVRLVRIDGDGQEDNAVLWISARPGASGPDIERVQHDEVWLQPLLGRQVGDSVTFTEGQWRNTTWTIREIFPGQFGLQHWALDWAKRQGLEGGGVDEAELPNDEEFEALERHMQRYEAAAQHGPRLVSVALRAHLEHRLPPQVVSRKRPAVWCPGTNEARAADRRVLADIEHPPRFLIDPVTLVVAETGGWLDTLTSVTGGLRMAAGVKQVLRGWWALIRTHRAAKLTAVLDQRGRLLLRAMDARVRRDLNLAVDRLQARLVNATWVDPPGPLASRATAGLAQLEPAFDPGTIATLWAIAATGETLISVDFRLVELARALGLRAVSLETMLDIGVETAQISVAQSVDIKVHLSQSGWGFMAITATELIAALRNPNLPRARRDVEALTYDFGGSEPGRTLEIVLAALNDVGPMTLQVGGMRVDEFLFSRMPTLTTVERKAVHQTIRRRDRRSWFGRAISRWLERR